MNGVVVSTKAILYLKSITGATPMQIDEQEDLPPRLKINKGVFCTHTIRTVPGSVGCGLQYISDAIAWGLYP